MLSTQRDQSNSYATSQPIRSQVQAPLVCGREREVDCNQRLLRQRPVQQVHYSLYPPAPTDNTSSSLRTLEDAIAMDHEHPARQFLFTDSASFLQQIVRDGRWK